MIVCVAANPAIDRTLEVECLTPGAIHRPHRVTAVAGGKGLNVARTAAALGGSVCAAALLGGHNGRWIAEQLAQHRVEAHIARRAGETRVCVSILSVADGRLTEFYEPGDPVQADEWVGLEQQVNRVVAQDSIVTLSGSLPPGVSADAWASITRVAHAVGARVIADSYGGALRGIIEQAPALVKVNAAEASEATGVDVLDISSAVAAAQALVGAGGSAAVVTLGVGGAVLVDGASAYLCGVGPRGAYPVGSGDAFLAGLAVGMQRGNGLGSAMRLGAAAAAANAAVPGPGILDAVILEESLRTISFQRL